MSCDVTFFVFFSNAIPHIADVQLADMLPTLETMHAPESNIAHRIPS